MMPDFVSHRHPVLAVGCPDCGARSGVWCRRPSGHKASDLHLSRKRDADAAFIELYGEDASIEYDGRAWFILPEGRLAALSEVKQLS